MFGIHDTQCITHFLKDEFIESLQHILNSPQLKAAGSAIQEKCNCLFKL